MLILGGTGEARRLAARLPGEVVSSLAGRVAAPRLPEGEVRVGGFGGVDGLVEWLRANGITAVVDATHPFAATMTAHAVEATARAGVPLLVLRRPGWTAGPGDDWRWVGSLEEAAADLPGERVFLTTGRQDVGVFAGCGQFFLARSVDPPEPPMPQRIHVLLDRGPFTVDGEVALMREHAIDVLVTKDSGGGQTSAKLAAARLLGVPVVVVRRPPPPAAPTVDSVDAAVEWVRRGSGGA
ncbi:cobalt-precorrin-6A reductase [Umezawaea endophytica]|uniref:Cobalt-precorrin-6A reductase n=1 Tax=Umezawaea endophytica TaxID=1654476 RepID=A0A9X3AHM5_9PSEU|nr:cobalt-precorrin-6A reductase [Umezawaea endophytica]MCS7481231.1 cobalt-precorrin-6A reductase [Umezawaea endophytica]